MAGVNLRMRRSLIQEDHAHLGAAQQIIHVVGHFSQFDDFLLVLGVDRVQFLVDRVQLLVGALQLFVRGHELLVGGLQLLVAGLHLFDGGLQIFLRLS